MVRMSKPLRRARVALIFREFGLVLSVVGAVMLVASRGDGRLW